LGSGGRTISSEIKGKRDATEKYKAGKTGRPWAPKGKRLSLPSMKNKRSPKSTLRDRLNQQREERKGVKAAGEEGVKRKPAPNSGARAAEKEEHQSLPQRRGDRAKGG